MPRTTPVTALFCLLAGCAPSDLADSCSRRLNAIDPAAAPVVLSGVSAAVEMTLPIIVICPKGPPVATDVTTSVLDAQNAPVASASTPPVTSSTEGYSTTVTFTPDAGGVFSINTTFQPSIGSSQRQVQVVADRGAEPALAQRAGCSSFELLQSALICRRASALEVLRAGAVVQTLSADASLAAGQVLWVWAQGSVTRYEDHGAGPLVGTGSAPFPDPLSATVAAEADRLLAVSGAAPAVTYQELKASAGALASHSLTLPAPGPSSTTGLLPVDANTIAYGSVDSKLCVVTLAPLSAACPAIALGVFAREGEVLWVRGLAGDPAVGYLQVVLGAPSVTMLTARVPGQLLDTGLARPSFRWSARTLFPRLPELVLESWAPSAPIAAGVGQGVVWFVDGNGAGTVFARSP